MVKRLDQGFMGSSLLVGPVPLHQLVFFATADKGTRLLCFDQALTVINWEMQWSVLPPRALASASTSAYASTPDPDPDPDPRPSTPDSRPPTPTLLRPALPPPPNSDPGPGPGPRAGTPTLWTLTPRRSDDIKVTVKADDREFAISDRGGKGKFLDMLGDANRWKDEVEARTHGPTRNVAALWPCPRSAPAPPRGAPGGSWRRRAPRGRRPGRGRPATQPRPQLAARARRASKQLPRSPPPTV